MLPLPLNKPAKTEQTLEGVSRHSADTGCTVGRYYQLRGLMSSWLAVGGVMMIVLTAVTVAIGGMTASPVAAVQTQTQVQTQAQARVVDAAVMGGTRVSAGQMAAWLRARSAQPYRATVSVEQLATMFVQEGNNERVSGDLAFVQAVVETGWFSFSGRVPPSANNFGGIGATDSTKSYNVFRSARAGVRAHIQHLRAYGDPTVTRENLTYPLESPRFHLVTPKGKAPRWSNMGAGNWATDPLYSAKILTLYSDMVAFAGYPQPPAPFGSLDGVTNVGASQLRVRGWAIDPDTTEAIGIHVYVNDVYAGATTALGVRTDVGAVWPAWGPNRGFDFTINTRGGTNRVCAYAINSGPGTSNPLLGCTMVQSPTGNPFGNLDAVTNVGVGQVRVQGWAIDPDTTSPLRMHIYVDGYFSTDIEASAFRPDVGAAFAGYGNNHGFDATVAVAPEGGTVCVFALNAGSGTVNTLLGCWRP